MARPPLVKESGGSVCRVSCIHPPLINGGTSIRPRGRLPGVRLHALVLASVAAFAGCLGTSDLPSVDPTEDALAALPWDEVGALLFQPGHDHTDRALHQEVTRGLDVLAQATLTADGKSAGEYFEADAENGILAVGIVTGPGSDVRVVLLDVAALPELKILGSFDEPQAYGDIKVDPDDPLVYVAFTADVTGQAFSIWDISDPARPARVGAAPGPLCHMLHAQTIDGESYVWCAGVGGAQAFQIIDLPNGQRSGVAVGNAMVQRDPEVARYADYYTAISPIGPALATTPHDMTAQADPLTGDPIVVTAYELQGIRVYDVSTPSAPVEVSAWRGEGMDEPLERVHTVGLFEWQGKRIGVGTTETFSNVPPALYLVDFTDYANPTFLARWVPPGIDHDDSETTLLAYSLHNFQFVGGRLYITNFHGGVWVLDLADPAAPREVAVHMQVLDTEYPGSGSGNVNMYWDVVVENGYVVVTDMSSGIEVLHVEGDPGGDPAWRGFT